MVNCIRNRPKWLRIGSQSKMKPWSRFMSGWFTECFLSPASHVWAYPPQLPSFVGYVMSQMMVLETASVSAKSEFLSCRNPHRRWNPLFGWRYIPIFIVFGCIFLLFGWHITKEGYLFWECFFSVLFFFLDFCFPASLLFCFSAPCFLLVCFSKMYAFLLFPASLLLCFSLLLCCSAFPCFFASLLSMLLCFSAFLLSLLFCFSSLNNPKIHTQYIYIYVYIYIHT